jgi:hypothetical protein
MMVDKVKLLLTAVSIAISVLPIAGVLLAYSGNLLGLVIPPEINMIVNDEDGGIISESALEEAIENFKVVESHYDAEARTVSLTFEVTNPLKFNVSVNSMIAEVRCAEHDFPLGYAVINNPVEIDAGETASVTVDGGWTQEAVNHVMTAHEGEKTIDIELTGISVDISGLSIQTDQVFTIPDFPIG